MTDRVARYLASSRSLITEGSGPQVLEKLAFFKNEFEILFDDCTARPSQNT